MNMLRLSLVLPLLACAPDSEAKAERPAVGDAEARERRERHRDVAKLEPGRLAELVERAERVRHLRDTAPPPPPPPPPPSPPPEPYVPLYRITVVIPDVGKREMLVFDTDWKDGTLRYVELRSCMRSLERQRRCWVTWLPADQVRLTEFVREIPNPFK